MSECIAACEVVYAPFIKLVFGRSFWTLTGSPTLLNGPSLGAFAKTKALTQAQTMYRVAQHWGIIPLAGSTNDRHMKDGVDVESVSLMDEEVPSDIYEYVWGTEGMI